MRFNHRLGRLGSIKPDIVIDVNDWAMIVEVDEFQHKKYERDGEDGRLEQVERLFQNTFESSSIQSRSVLDEG